MTNRNNINSLLFKITRVITLIVGIIACITLFGAIIGIPLIIASVFYKNLVEMTDDEVAQEADKILIWGVVLAIIIFPLGLIPLIAAFNLNGQLFGGNQEFKKTQTVETSSGDKVEKIKKLYELKEQGIIDEEEFKMAKAKILSE